VIWTLRPATQGDRRLVWMNHAKPHKMMKTSVKGG
jgi:hypothetical protein